MTEPRRLAMIGVGRDVDASLARLYAHLSGAELFEPKTV